MVDQLATYLAGEGHEVAVAAGLPSHPTPAGFDASRRVAYSSAMRNGFLVIRGGHPRPTSRSAPVRGAALTVQALAATLASLTFTRPDVVIVFGFPMMGPVLAACRAILSDAAVVTVVYDLYPDIAIESGLIPGSIPKRLAHGVAAVGYRAADRIVVLSKGFQKELASRGIPNAKIDVIPVWLDPDEIHPSMDDGSWARDHGLDPHRPIALYAGTLGLVSGADVLVGAAAALDARSDVQFVIVGDGQLKPALQHQLGQRNLRNVTLLPFQPRADLGRMQSAATVSLVTLAKGRGRTSVPSKVLAYLAAGTPVVGSVDDDSDTASCIRSSGGTVTPPGDAEALAHAIDEIAAAGDLDRRSALARKYFEENFAKDVVLARFLRSLTALADHSGSR